MKRVLSFFFTDIHWKLLSLMLAFLLWFLAINMTNPIQNTSYSVPLEMVNMEILTNAGLVVVNKDALDRDIQVGISASRLDLEYLNSLSNDPARRALYITPSVDFRAVNVDDIIQSGGAVTVPLSVSVNLSLEGLGYFSISPRIINVEIDMVAQGAFDVSVDIEGEVDSGLELQPIRLANNRVTITGTRTTIAKINKVQVAVEVWGIQEDEVHDNLPLMVLDAEGNDMTHLVTLSVSETTAFLSVWPVETVGIQVAPVGALAPGFAVESIDFEPKTVEVTGAADTLRELEYIALEVNLAGRDTSFVDHVDLQLPAGVYLRHEADALVDVMVNVEPVERRVFIIPMDNVRSRGISVRYDVLSEMATIRIDVYGPRALLSELTSGDIGLELDLRNMAIGVHHVPLTVDLPTDIYLAQRAPTLQVEILEPATADENDDHDFDPDPAAPVGVVPPLNVPGSQMDNQMDNQIDTTGTADNGDRDDGYAPGGAEAADGAPLSDRDSTPDSEENDDGA